MASPFIAKDSSAVESEVQEACLKPRKLLHRSIPTFAKDSLGPDLEDKIVYVRGSLNSLHKL
ncbi:hypothetical protein SS1G_13689 [Sclerotinia sclerotiorum 1980 UF-70]|uniref:Uncharacterized protein n=1 Tax=Sclerotinia sclerotiorum (strain ATCC 18683 / 1980 / Ss-1) TaxID=665079 RepID=A7F7V9_SCLS1|nr:hypothetical protein SS1G_13689 [Sclerotinia sclerotiorum 1980 UF-70]EDN98830.1 hypothetical protein SS1G_13689 [Sclerotinia sclerotiorum 1980 UF-70]